LLVDNPELPPFDIGSSAVIVTLNAEFLQSQFVASTDIVGFVLSTKTSFSPVINRFVATS